MVTFKVQTDRIQSNDESVEAWVAIKISAVNDQPAPTQADVSALLPWKWEALGGGVAWSPHSPHAWALWWVDPNDRTIATLIDPNRIRAVSAVVPNVQVEARLDAAVAAIAFPGGVLNVPALRFPEPNEETPLTGSVPGFVERLASAPHPVPSVSCVHALLAIGGLTQPSEFDGRQIIAAPRVVPLAGAPFDAAPLNPVFVPPGPGNEEDYHWHFPGQMHDAVLKASRLVKDMRADEASGRVLDLFDQTIAVTGDPRRTLPTAEALAGLPQALADAMDPIARLRSVLMHELRGWADEDPANRMSLRADLGFVDPVGPSFLKRMLDIVAVQILGPRYDAVGRFEVPLIEELEGRDDTVVAALLAAHGAAMPAGAKDSSVLAAWRMAPTDVFDPTYIGDPWERIAAASPFTLDHLRQQAGFELDTTTARVDVKPEAEVVRLLWSHAAAAPQVQAGETQGLRYFELPREQAGVADRPLHLLQRFKLFDAPVLGANASAASDIFAETSFDRARASAALAYAAPFVEGLVSGRVDWSLAQPGDVGAPLSDRFSASMRALLKGDGHIQGLYDTLLDQTAAVAGVATGTAMFDLMKRLLAAAGDEAIALAASLGPRVNPFDTVTQLPLPLSFQIDQLQTFSRHIDDWTRLSGYGLMVRRAGAASATKYVSLNAASMFFGLSQLPVPVRDGRYLPEIAELYGNRERINGVAADGSARPFVDPLAFAPGDQVGVSDAIAEYANSWQTAPMPGQAAMKEDGGARGVDEARILFGPPGKSGTKLPTLSFGRTYEVLGHLVAQGGVLSRFARHATNPYLLGDNPTVSPQLIATIPYLRTVGVSGPSFIADAAPIPSAVNMLVDELPKRPPPVRLTTSGIRMNVDPARGTPRLACAPGAEGGIRFEFVVDADGPANIDLNIETLEQSAPVVIALANGVRGQWYRLDVLRSGEVTLTTRTVGNGAEDELRAFPDWTIAAQSQLGFQPKAAMLRLASQGAVDVEPLRIAIIQSHGGVVTEISESEVSNAPRAAALLLDGLDVGSTPQDKRLSNGLVRTRTSVRVQGPSIDRHTWERWVNCALFAAGADATLRTRIAAKLNKLQSEDAETRSDLPDPATTGLWLELWTIFPKRARVSNPLIFFADRTDPLATPSVTVDVQVGDPNAPPAEIFVANGSKAAIAKCLSGQIYELRSRAIIRAQDAPFDHEIPNAARFGPAVLETFVATNLGGEALLLGPSTVLPIEVATAKLPVLNSLQWVSAKVVPLRWVGNRRLVDLKFPAGLFQGADGGRRLLRYCSEASLVPQHWTWRGRPVSQGQSHVFENAFEGRLPTDHGILETGRLRISHALSLEPGTVGDAPVVVSRDLDWRGGWNLWRFGVTLKSRYAALFQTKVEAIANSELHRKDTHYRWLDCGVPDAENGREVSKPPLILILPLTEAGSDDDLVPPLLALLGEPMHANANFGDGVVVGVEVARHPYPEFQRNPGAVITEPQNKLKYLPEVGPDPIRSGLAHPGSAVALRLEGPIGYGFDLGSEAGRFTHSGYIISPVQAKLAPWSMIKLKLRRLERSGLSGAVDSVKELEPVAVRGPGIRPSPSAADQSQSAIPYEGLIVEPVFVLDNEFDVVFFRDVGLADGPAGQRVVLNVSAQGNSWAVNAWVRKVLPDPADDWMSSDGSANAGTFSFIRGSHQPSVRLIVSARTRPENGVVWTPSGEVMVQVNLGDGEAENGGNGWVTAFSLPIEAAHLEPVSGEPRIVLSVPSKFERARMSDFSPSMWCQFTVASSNVRVSPKGLTATDGEIVHVRELDLKRSGGAMPQTWRELVVHRGDQPQVLLPDVSDASAASSEMVEVRIALFTEFAFDMSRQVRERPIAAVLLKDRLEASKNVTGVDRVLWEDVLNSKPTRDGRWRLLRVLRRRDDEITELGQLFAEPFGEISDQPADALGMVMTVSQPFPDRRH